PDTRGFRVAGWRSGSPLPKSRAQPRDPSPPVLCGSRTCKPNSVRNMNAAGRSFLWATHCCGAQATYPEVVARRASTRYRQSPKAYQEIPPYLVLLRVGFALPAALLRRRCALTAPFHPYLGLAARAVCFLWHFPSNQPTLAKNARMGHPPGRYPAHCSAEFGLSSVLRQRPSGPAANRFIIEQADRTAGWHQRIVSARWRVLSLHLFGCEEERVCQQGQADQQRNQSGEIDRLVVHQPMQKRHDTDADDGRNQTAQLHAFEAAFRSGLILFTHQFDRGLRALA